jgi:hypothetical protein
VLEGDGEPVYALMIEVAADDGLREMLIPLRDELGVEVSVTEVETDVL